VRTSPVAEGSERSSATRGQRIAAAATVALCLVTWGLCVFRIPWLQAIPRWRWIFSYKKATPEAWWIVPLLGLVFGLVQLVRRPGARAAVVLPVLVVSGFLLQLGFGWMEGRGIEALRIRMVQSGHAAFARQAVEPEPAPAEILSRYYYRIADGTLSRYPHATKPPGMLLAYVALERLSRRVASLRNLPALERLTLFASYACPFLTYLVLLPLFGLSRLLLDRERGYLPALLFLCIPSVNLFTLHMDQCLYPLLATLPVVAFVASLETRRTWLAALVGPLAYLAIFLSFSMVALLPLLVLFALLRGIQALRATETPSGGAWRRIVLVLTLALVGLVLTHVAVRGLLGYDAVYGYGFAMRNHEFWKVKAWTPATRVHGALLGVFEFFYWIGIPLTVLACAALGRAWTRSRAARGSALDALVLSTALTLLLVAVFGKTMGETSRLWLFLAPLIALFAAARVPLGLRGNQPVGLHVVLLLQLGTTFVFKLYQDFH